MKKKGDMLKLYFKFERKNTKQSKCIKLSGKVAAGENNIYKFG